MKVIHSIKENYPKRVMCDGCFAELEYTKDDIYIGAYGCAYIKCPVCNEELALEDESADAPDLTINTVQWPQHFFGTSRNAVDIDDEQIQKWVSECLQRLERKSDVEGDYTLTGSGNTMVFAFKFEDEYAVYVTKSYADTVIPR